MSSIVWVDPLTPLPDPRKASLHGLLAAGADLSVERLSEAYRKGIFPWFNEGDPVLWWSPDPRMVLACEDLRISRSLAKVLRRIQRDEHRPQAAIRVTTDLAFAEVIHACAQPAAKREATWISPSIQSAYIDWHRAGQAHSIEVWKEGALVGGLYGVCLGGMFFGESMFSRMRDASKIALVYLVRMLKHRHISHIDCQQETDHLKRLGARAIPREAFLDYLSQVIDLASPPWPSGQITHSGELRRLHCSLTQRHNGE